MSNDNNKKDVKKEIPAVTTIQLKELLNRHNYNDDDPVQVILNVPSIGGQAVTEVVSARFGIDWDRGLLLTVREKIVKKEEKQDIFESASDLLMMLATEWYTLKKDKFENRRAREILLKFGYTDENMRKYVSLFHKNKEIVR